MAVFFGSTMWFPGLIIVNLLFLSHSWRINPNTDYYDDLQEIIELNEFKKQLMMKSWPNKITEENNWPEKPLDGGIRQVVGVDVGSDGKVHMFHRGTRVWDDTSFDPETNVYQQVKDGSIINDTIIVLDADTGHINKTWGANRFFMPHGITIDKKGNTWLTDVALHQVFKFEPGSTSPDLVLGEALVPGDDRNHFCKPTDVAVTSNGDIFVSDGYCNSRVIMFDNQGKYITQIGTKDWMMVPHSLSLDEDNNRLYVADRENHRILCYSALLNKGPVGIKCRDFTVSKGTLGHVFGVAQAGESIFAVTGNYDGKSNPDNSLIQISKGGELMKTWQPAENKLVMPHDIAIDPKRTHIYFVDGFENAKKKIYKIKLSN